MIGSLLEKLQALLPKRFLIAALAPTLMIVIANGALLRQQNLAFAAWVSDSAITAKPSDDRFAAAGALALVVFVVALVLTIINTFLRELLEGEHWPKWLRAWLTAPHKARLAQKRAELDAAYGERRRLIIKKDAIVAAWKGKTKVRKGDATFLATLEPMRSQLVSWADLSSHADKLEDALREDAAGADADKTLITIYDLFHDIADELLKRLDQQIIQTHGEVQFSFVGEAAPTKLGNVTAILRDYSFSRYGVKFEIVWGALQKVMQGDPFYEVVQDAKTMVDLVVATFWLLVVSVIGWWAYFLCCGQKVLPAAFVLVGVPCALILLYSLTIESHRAFAALIRTAIDLYRFKVLDALKIAPPIDATQERRLWSKLNRQLGFGDEVVLTYRDGSRQ